MHDFSVPSFDSNPDPNLDPTPALRLPRRAPAAPRRHARRLGLLSATALLLHVALLGGGAWLWPSTDAAALPTIAPNPRAVRVQVVDAQPVTTAPAEAQARVKVAMTETTSTSTANSKPASTTRAADPTPKPATRTASSANLSRRAARSEPLAPIATDTPPLPPTTPATPATLATIDMPATLALSDVQTTPETAPEAVPKTSPKTTPAVTPAAPASAPTASADDEPIPQYRTRVPPPTTLRYDVSRGALRGTGELAWRPQAASYELKLDFKLSGLTILSQVSSGGFDAAGLAPLRFTDQRLRRGTTAANFQRDAAKITYSGSSNEFALKPGAQDRLSWMLQLAAIVSAEPRLVKPGAKVAMAVTGSRGDLDVWVFRCVGPESIDARGGQVATIRFVREPREPQDTEVQVWLDPKLGNLPVRATQKSANDEGYELHLTEVVAAR